MISITTDLIGMATLKMTQKVIFLDNTKFRVINLDTFTVTAELTLTNGDQFVNVFDGHFYGKQVYAVQRLWDSATDFYYDGDPSFFSTAESIFTLRNQGVNSVTSSMSTDGAFFSMIK